VVGILEEGGVIAYPSDSCYALGCVPGAAAAVERIRKIRALGSRHDFTLVCRNLSSLAEYAKVGNAHFRVLKAHTPGPYTFLLPASRSVPRRLLQPKRRTIGLRVPDSPVVGALLERLDGPLLSVSLVLPGEEHPPAHAAEVADALQGRVDAVLDAGPCGTGVTTVVDMTGSRPEVVRPGLGDCNAFGR